ncbi:aspartate/glutamate racemase family protein [Celeribacter indicus]|uniref:Asp/Glu racemase n=1 Tax=Celeribacter indicus TaxID=1208324 RepID=A0A0B5E117_9RHOB|nr:aspartate/glutamate racemase family protein [Celeribacter indicus]AJE47100.1 Asp/Glu racemase [Celeribacter indicus]SDW90898.1 allantoin racemase [Celeribacter indicus]
MKLTYINPNSTARMTRGIVSAARQALPEAEITGLTNTAGPPAIEGPADGAAALPGVLSLLETARAGGADAVVIACFDDTGLAEARAQADCPVLGIGQSSYVMATLLGLRYSVITSLPVSVPVLEGNIAALGLSGLRASVRACGLPVLTIEAGAAGTIERIVAEMRAAKAEDGAECVLLGCAGMAPLAGLLAARTGMRVIDGVAASAHLAQAAAKCTAPPALVPGAG